MKTEIAWSTDSHNIVFGPQYHDSHIVHFAYSQTSRLMSFVMRDQFGDYTQCEASGIIQLSVNELWEGTIISEIFAWKAASVMENVPDTAWNTLFAKRFHTVSEAHRDVSRIVQKQPDAILIEIQSSYGGDIGALCERLTFWKIDADPGMGKIVLDPSIG